MNELELLMKLNKNPEPNDGDLGHGSADSNSSTAVTDPGLESDYLNPNVILDDTLDISELPFTSSTLLESIEHDDKLVEIVAYIDEIEEIRTFGGEKSKEAKRRWRIYVHNNDGKRIQVTFWNKEIEKWNSLIQLGYKIHIDGAYSKYVENSSWNLGNLPYELVIQNNTIIHCQPMNDNITTDPMVLKFEELSNASGCITTKGYIKTAFQKVTSTKDNYQSYWYGSITDGTYKLDVKVLDCDNLLAYKKGSPVSVKGYLKNLRKYMMQVNSKNNIKQLTEDSMDLRKLTAGSQNIHKRKNEDNTHSNTKKSRQQ
ncbi:uncharacterized protein LOC122498949 isoform X2 [Leptopilina heterotoma]|uniref:uncharacterized protein LOC122498949 isoform X2 n=1 Tax=Leptopilina heterotoma TaxID=63436 RepID=UPI001CA9C9B2|nr:uncharacterized protein LOC122498949 isoform X2 [Leptopilina heterotoma]